jgi:hypothetical protein
MVTVTSGRRSIVRRWAGLSGLALAALMSVPFLAAEPALAGPVKDGAVCLLTKSTKAPRALVLNSGAEVYAPNCRVHVRSEQAPAAVFNRATRMTAKQVCVAGPSVIRNQVTVDRLALNCDASRDPYYGKLPQPTVGDCTHKGGVFGSRSVTLKPGVYCNRLHFNRAKYIRLEPGVYVIKGGDWIVNGGRFAGEGVSIYFADSHRIQFNSGVSIDLSAPTSGPMKDILFSEKPGLRQSRIVFNDVKSNKMSGLVWLPSRNVTFNKGGNLTSYDMAMVVNTLILNEVKWVLSPFGKPTD